MLKAIERVTGARIAVEKLPTVADLRARRLELTRACLEEAILEDDLDHFRVVAAALAEEFDVMDVAAAAVKLAHESSATGTDEEEIPDQPVPEGDGRRRRERTARHDRRDERRARGPGGSMTRLFIGAGRKTGIRPQDIVGAIANESSLSGREIGAIQIADRFSLVEIPASAADEVIGALRSSTIKGKRVSVRRKGR
jgi:ATP-dependent RNA helicase DeaD